MRVFLFGAAFNPSVREALGLPHGTKATFPSARAVAAADGVGATWVPEEGSAIEGELVQLDDDAMAISLWRAMGADPQEVVLSDGVAKTFCAPPHASNRGWDLAKWGDQWGATYARGLDEMRTLLAFHDVSTLRQWRNQLMVRAASWVRAQTDVSPMTVRSGLKADDVLVDRRQSPYLSFFALEEHELRFGRFHGGHSPAVHRTCLVMGDAVTVLPYDPKRDRVLVVEQFRFGPFVRGDQRPWSLEPIAGRVDPGEAPEHAARRETQEEAGLEVGALHRIGTYYPSPGAVSEYLYSYVGLTDLPDDAAGIGGLETEDEDIRGVILSFDALMGLLDSGEAQNGPLILSALWLKANREKWLVK